MPSAPPGHAAGLRVRGNLRTGAYWWSDRIVLRMYRARELGQAEAPNSTG
jgi:hypothetical protein